MTEDVTGVAPQPDQDDRNESDSDHPRSAGPFGGLSPQEASRRGVAVRRERAAARREARQSTRDVVAQRLLERPDAVRRMVDALLDDATTGDAATRARAARVLATYLDQGFGRVETASTASTGDSDASPLTREQRQVLLAALMEGDDEDQDSGHDV